MFPVRGGGGLIPAESAPNDRIVVERVPIPGAVSEPESEGEDGAVVGKVPHIIAYLHRIKPESHLENPDPAQDAEAGVPAVGTSQQRQPGRTAGMGKQANS